ncbi:MAG: HNH endonuclease [Terriglobales bacterium]
MPRGARIKGRTSSIRNAFVAAIVPSAAPSVGEIARVLDIFGLEPEALRCSYCGGVATEWDHLRPLVSAGMPTGYPSSIRNLVPSCGKCNQSKGNKDWREWMRSGARWSPASRGISGLEERERRLAAFEDWAKCERVDVNKLAAPETWKRYYGLLDEILTRMGKADALAAAIAGRVRAPGRARSARAGS